MFFRKQKEIDRLNARCSELAGMVRDKNNRLKEERKNNLLILDSNISLATIVNLNGTLAELPQFHKFAFIFSISSTVIPIICIYFWNSPSKTA